ncbi:MAG: nicotinate phosphoribosyltransferase, partial [Clostridia bacterium]|nr:nicotinate phosphoribosyltransferase [Clostridia bacterium]
MENKLNLTLLTDFYEFTMANGFFSEGVGNKTAYFDMFFRTIPSGGGFAIMAGVEQLIDYFKNLKFTDEDIDYLRSKKIFNENYLEYLKNFEFACDVWAIPEGTPIFPQEPIVTVRGPIVQAQFLETMILLTINHQSLIATKANRIVRAAAGRPVMEFGSRRAQGADAAILGARAAYIGGCSGTACAIADREYGVPALGTMAHSWVQMFDSEYEAFTAYARQYPDSCMLLIDTYNVLESGLPNAIKVFDEVLKPMNKRPKG